MHDYPVDGIYNDLGYLPLAGNKQFPTKDEVFAFEESSVSDGALSDLLGELYAEVHRRGGLVKIHQGGTDKPHTDSAIYDYLWVGEEIESGDALREAVKAYLPSVIPCLDMSRARIADEDELYLHSVPYMQFPLLWPASRLLARGAQFPAYAMHQKTRPFGRSTAEKSGSFTGRIKTGRLATAGGTRCLEDP